MNDLARKIYKNTHQAKVHKTLVDVADTHRELFGTDHKLFELELSISEYENEYHDMIFTYERNKDVDTPSVSLEALQKLVNKYS